MIDAFEDPTALPDPLTQALEQHKARHRHAGMNIPPITDAFIRFVTHYVRLGSDPMVAAGGIGVDPGVWERMVRHGQRYPESKCGLLVKAVEVASHQAEMLMHETLAIGPANRFQGTAWRLERKQKQRWGAAARQRDGAALQIPGQQPGEAFVHTAEEAGQVLGILRELGVDVPERFPDEIAAAAEVLEGDAEEVYDESTNAPEKKTA